MKDTSGARVTTIEWGETEEDVLHVASVLEHVQRAGDRAALASQYAPCQRSFVEELRGAATMLGLVPDAEEDVVAELRGLLVRSRDVAGATSEGILHAAHGKGPEAERAAHRAAAPWSGRRGWLDSAVYFLDRGARFLEEVRAWEQQRVTAGASRRSG
jgi:hypothetical protein